MKRSLLYPDHFGTQEAVTSVLCGTPYPPTFACRAGFWRNECIRRDFLARLFLSQM